MPEALLVDELLGKSQPSTGGSKSLVDDLLNGGIPAPGPQPSSGTPVPIPPVQMMPLSGAPEIGSVPTQELTGGEFDAGAVLKLVTAFIVERDPMKRAQIIQEALPGSEIREDASGNVGIRVDGRDFIINRPGASGQDLMELVAIVPQIAAVIGGARGGQAIASNVGRVGGAGLAAGTVSRLEDVTSQGLGSSREPDITKDLTIGATAAVGEAAVPFIFSRVGKAFNALKTSISRGQGLTQGVRRVLERAGVNADDLTPETLAELRTIARQAKTPEEAIRLAEARGLGVPLTRGQVSQGTAQQARELAAEKGVFGEPAEGVITQFREGQRSALTDAARRTQAQVGAGGVVQSAGEGVGVAQQALATQQQALRAAVNTAFGDAKARSASILSEGVQDIARAVRSTFTASFNPNTAPKAASLANDLAGFQSRFPGRVKAVTVRALENWRQQVSALTRSNDTVEAAAAQNLLGSFDEAVFQSVDDALIKGDVGAVTAFKQARGLRRELAQKFGVQRTREGAIDPASRIVNDLVDSVSGELKLTAQEARKRLFGAGILGDAQGAVRATEKVKRLLGANSDAWKAIKEDAFLTFFKRQGDNFSGETFAKAIDDTFRLQPRMVRALFTKEDVARIQTLKRVVRSVTVPKKGAENFSNTTIVNRLIGNFGFVGKATEAIIRTALAPLFRQTGRARAETAVTRPLGQVFPPGGGIGAAVGSVISEETLGP